MVAAFEVGTGVALLTGMFVVRSGRVRFHKWLQATIVLVNVPVVLSWMVPQYLEYVLPGLPGELAQPYYLLPTLALFAGAAAELLGVYILLVAGTNWLPERWRFRRYKLVMRTELGLWWTLIVLGLTIYAVWYAPTTSSSTPTPW